MLLLRVNRYFVVLTESGTIYWTFYMVSGRFLLKNPIFHLWFCSIKISVKWLLKYRIFGTWRGCHLFCVSKGPQPFRKKLYRSRQICRLHFSELQYPLHRSQR